MALETYRGKRRFGKTQEPPGTVGGEEGFSFVVQKHAASRLHYDFRLELGGVLLSWAVPKGPSLDPKVKRLAMQVEDHPIEYAGFEGIIPQGEYGGGTVMVWDRGRWIPDGDPHRGYAKGHLKFRLEGQKLRGSWHLVRTRGGANDKSGDGESGKTAWLLFKGTDEQASSTIDIVEREPASALSGRSMEQIAKSPDRVWSSKREPEEPDLGRIEGAKQAPFPDEVEPQLATLATVAPEGDEWCHEIKFDGYRILAHIHDGQVSLHSRRGLDWSARFGAVAKDLAALPVRSAVLDGEMVVLDQHGVSDFQALQNSLQSGPRAPGGLTYYAFDLLYLDGWDLRGARLDARKEALRSIFAGRATAVSAVRFSDHVVGQGGAYRDEACKLGLEGIVCKRRDAIYRGGRSTSWLKVKCAARQEFVIGGFSDPGGSRELFGALLLGVYENGQLRYAGKSGSGFSESSLRQIYGKLKALEQADPPFVNPPTGADAKGVHWIRPEVVAEIAFAGFTDDGRARQAIFHGLREDKSASEVSRERARDPESIEVRNAGRRKDGATAAMALTHPDRILYPEQGLTKRALAEYYQQVAPFMIPHVANRPLTLLRCPEGQGSTCFFQKHSHVGLVRGLSPVQIKENGGEGTYLVLHDLEGLVALVQMGVLEIHVWGARADLPDAPDRLVFDLDPDEDVGWPAVVAAAKEVRDRFSAIGLVSFVKTTGGKGLHVVVPVRRDSKQFDWDKAKSFCKAMAQSMEKDSPTRYLSIATKAKRKGKIYVDYLRNGRGATAIAPYSSRAKAGATVSAPLAWEELDTLASSSAYTVQSMARRLVDLPGDPWSDLPSIDQMLDRKLLSKL